MWFEADPSTMMEGGHSDLLLAETFQLLVCINLNEILQQGCLQPSLCFRTGS